MRPRSRVTWMDRSGEIIYGAVMKGRYQVYFERARIPIAAVDGLGRVRESNPAFRSAVARTAEELDGLLAEELLAPGEIDAQRPHWRMLALGRLDVYRTRMR